MSPVASAVDTAGATSPAARNARRTFFTGRP
jgi:hypothetical protein